MAVATKKKSARMMNTPGWRRRFSNMLKTASEGGLSRGLIAQIESETQKIMGTTSPAMAGNKPRKRR
jgi:hypothetical protein